MSNAPNHVLKIKHDVMEPPATTRLTIHVFPMALDRARDHQIWASVAKSFPGGVHPGTPLQKLATPHHVESSIWVFPCLFIDRTNR